ncbi:hypothetical protein RCS94_00680 [Orbaceae bacterium ac157xtp]
MLITPSSYGALSATSANTIQGSRPTFTNTSGAKKLGFVVDGTPYSESLNNINPSVTKNFNASLKLSDFTVTGLTATDFNPTTDYYDADGDTGYTSATDAFSMDSVTYDWYEGNTRLDKTNPTVMNQTLKCGSGLSLPLTLKITLPKVKVKSRYGNPRESIETNLVQEYKIGSTSGICFAKPNQMIVDPGHTWFGTNNSTRYWNNASYKSRNYYGGGYDSNQFDPANGFKASLNPKFPTTGFPKASFTLIMEGNPTDYIFNSNDSVVIVDLSGKVTLNSKPSGAVTITATKNGTASYYTFDPRTPWVVPKKNPANSNGYYNTYADAKTECGGANKIPTRADLTNSPFNNVGQHWGQVDNGYTRAVGGGVLGEWGWTNSSNYPDSQWILSGLPFFFTRDPWSSVLQYNVRPENGRVEYNSTYSASLACLG